LTERFLASEVPMGFIGVLLVNGKENVALTNACPSLGQAWGFGEGGSKTRTQA
jgi:hypothetical protein